MLRPTLDEIYGSTSTTVNSTRPSLDSIYGGNQASSPVPQMQPEQGFFQGLGNAITRPFTSIGGGIQNLVRAGASAIGVPESVLGSQQAYTPSVFGGQTDTTGYRDGQQLSAGDTAIQAAGNAAEGLSYGIGGGAVTSAGRGILAKTLPLAGQLAKEGAIVGGLSQGGQAVAEGQSLPDAALETLKGSVIGGVLTPLIGVPLGLIPLATKSGRQAITKELETKYIQQASNDWANVGNDYVKSGGILSRETKFGKDSTKFLGELGLSPKDLISGGKFQTEDIAGQLSSSAIKDFDNTLTDMLSASQFSRVKPSLSSMESMAISKVDDVRNVTEAQKLSIISNIKSEFSALRGRYGESVSLHSINVQKGSYWANTRFDATKPFQGDVNYIIGSTMKDTIERAVPDAPVRELNGLLGNYYAASKFLRSINNRVPKLTAGERLSGTISRVAGTLTGGAIGGPGGAISGYLFGKSLSDVMRKASNPLRNKILNNLEKTNPKVYEEALKYIGLQQREIWKNVTVQTATQAQQKAESQIQSAVQKVIR
jgi:hypothetical protein